MVEIIKDKIDYKIMAKEDVLYLLLLILLLSKYLELIIKLNYIFHFLKKLSVLIKHFQFFLIIIKPRI